MGAFKDLIPYFAGINTWISLAGAALFVFLVLFRTTATDFAINMNVPRRQEAGIVYTFMVLAAVVTIMTLALAFLDARDARASEAKRAALLFVFIVALSALVEPHRVAGSLEQQKAPRTEVL